MLDAEQSFTFTSTTTPANFVCKVDGATTPCTPAGLTQSFGPGTHQVSVAATNAAGAEMNAIASSIIGGTLLTGGVGNIIGTFFGTLTLTTIKKVVVTSGLKDPWWQSITTVAMLTFFILLQSVVLMRKNRAKHGKPNGKENPDKKTGE